MEFRPVSRSTSHPSLLLDVDPTNKLVSLRLQVLLLIKPTPTKFCLLLPSHMSSHYSRTWKDHNFDVCYFQKLDMLSNVITQALDKQLGCFFCWYQHILRILCQRKLLSWRILSSLLSYHFLLTFVVSSALMSFWWNVN